MKAVLFLSSFAIASATLAPAETPWHKEIVYQIFERSFYDSNGDRIGDFRGIAEKIPYLKRLGITTILIQPIFKSGFYHNYFANSFMEADPSLGGNRQFFAMVRRLHHAHIKVILDMEPQYVAEGHPWYKAKPSAGYIALRKGIFGLAKLPSYSGREYGVASVNMENPRVKRDLANVFRFWVAPHGDLNSGVDGFRIDHMMDDLDDTHVNTNLLAGFWAPLEAKVRRVKQGTFFVAEQSNWASLGQDLFSKGKVDSVYAIPLRQAFIDAVTKGSVEGLRSAIIAENRVTDNRHTQLIVIEDHDVSRYASLVKSDPRLLRLGAAFQMAIRGTPSIYYGQELGMKGTQLHGPDDGNDIPVRLAFRWKAKVHAKGQATWYGDGRWIKPGNQSDHDGISVQEEKNDPNSLLNFYRKLIRIRKEHPALTKGKEITNPAHIQKLVGFIREYRGEYILAIFNFSDEPWMIPVGPFDKDLISGQVGGDVGSLPAYGYRYIRIDRTKPIFSG